MNGLPTMTQSNPSDPHGFPSSTQSLEQLYFPSDFYYISTLTRQQLHQKQQLDIKSLRDLHANQFEHFIQRSDQCPANFFEFFSNFFLFFF